MPAAVAGIFPVLSVVAPKAIVGLLVLAGLYGIVLAVRRGVWRDLFPLAPTVFMALALGWMFYRGLTTFDGRSGVGVGFKTLGLGISGFGAFWLFGTLSPDGKRRVHNGLIAGICIALAVFALIAAAYKLGGFVWIGADRENAMTVLNRPQMILAMVSVLAWTVLLDRKRRAGAAGLAVVTVSAFMLTPAYAAVLALIVGVMGIALGKVLKGAGLKALAAVLLTAILASPIAAPLLLQGTSSGAFSAEKAKLLAGMNSLDGSISHRLYIWTFATNRALERPYLGWGLDTSRRIPGGNKLISIGKETLPLHPHNAILQVWLELGLPGLVFLAGVVGFAVLAPLGGSAPPLARGLRAGTVLAVFAIANIAFGIWQSWWVSSIWLTAALVTTFPDKGKSYLS